MKTSTAENKSQGLFSRLRSVQKDLSVPKGQTNKFGGYSYRSAEDILEAVKPLLDEQEIFLYISDEVVEITEQRIYVQATANVYFADEHLSCQGYAREEITKKGMDSSQITGAASSYARKYALAGLFLLDGERDSDATNNHKDETSADQLLKILEAHDPELVSKYLFKLKAIPEESLVISWIARHTDPKFRNRILANPEGFATNLKKEG